RGRVNFFAGRALTGQLVVRMLYDARTSAGRVALFDVVSPRVPPCNEAVKAGEFLPDRPK
ncbi:MAG TPA: hypothetical protein VK466_06455, partial [Terriglobales bacterium]|nr:hypothetical protein [Terriglobales bacterium]